MACNVFGEPITTSFLMEMPEFKDKLASMITVSDRARVAFSMKNADQKDVHARQYVQSLRSKSGPGGVSTLCLVYNATGDTITFVTSHDYFGHLATGDPYPTVIANGQWAGFLHGKTDESLGGSSAAVVFRGKNQLGNDYDWMLAWSNPFNRLSYSNKAYTEVREAGHYDNPSQEIWDKINGKIEQSHNYKRNNSCPGCFSIASIGNDTSPIFEGIMALIVR